MNINNLQQSRLVKFLSSYLAFVFIVLQVVDIISEPFSFSENLIVYLVYFFAFILVFVVLAAIRFDKKTDKSEAIKKSVNGNKVIPISLLIISVLIILNVYQFINTKSDAFSQKELRNHLNQLIETSDFVEAFILKVKFPDNLFIKEKLDDFSDKIKISSPNTGVSVFYKIDLDSLSTNNWDYLCDLPCEVVVPKGNIKYKFEKDGYPSVERLVNVRNSFSISFNKGEVSTGEMIFIENKETKLRTAGLDHLNNEKVGDYYIDKFEVTNREFAEFVNKGGYDDDALWKFDQLKNKDRKKLFVDKTGFPGPSEWELGDYPSQEENHPVSGISWFEAMAYCRSIGKFLPNIYQWDYSASLAKSSDIVPRSNMNGTAKFEVGYKKIISAFGLYDIAGNVAEWIYNSSDNNTKVIMGGSWEDPGYIFNTLFSKDPFNRDKYNGCRCVKSSDNNTSLLKTVSNPSFNVINAKPVTDDVYNAYLSMFRYSKFNLEPRILSDTLIESKNYKISKVSYNTPYGDRMFAYIYKPEEINLPARTIILFPGAGVINRESSETLFDSIPSRYEFLMRVNSIFVFPIYNSTFERRDGLINSIPFYDLSYRDRVIKWSKDLQTTIDYLETQDFVDKNRLHYYGTSWGARIAGIMLSTAPRFKSAILIVGGLRSQKRHPEADPINYLPRVKIPILMLNGKYDPIFPYDTSAEPMFKLFGTDIHNKKVISFESGHFVPRHELIKHSVDWFNSIDPQ
ncbi:MAG: SUMF1/EgtB/PvdO family nonheme iron enzyme [Candidatus Marinimicrobia bacterium]|nr:SUMF1/EgtB/PvdO family nonheme iron enzyme [Candidatus Neomarinimicrobiota bacterium]